MGTGVAMPHAKTGGLGTTMILGTGIFASSLLMFYYAQFGFHKRDNQTWLVRHGQQPGNISLTVRTEQPKLVTATVQTEPSTTPVESMVPLPTNNRGGEGVLPRVMSFVAGKGLNPDPKVPEKPLNKTQPTPQRINEAGTHHYTKRLPARVTE